MNYNHVHTLQGAETPAVEGTADDPRIRMPADLPSYEQTGWLGEAGATPALAGPNGAHADDAEVVEMMVTRGTTIPMPEPLVTP